jgi:hypothetical protein
VVNVGEPAREKYFAVGIHSDTISQRNRCGKTGAKPERQKAATDLPQFAAFRRLELAASCRLLPLSSPHTAAEPEGTGSKSVRHLP